MAKGGKKRKKTKAAPKRSRYRLKTWEAVLIGGAVILSLWLAWQWQQDKDVEAAFLALATAAIGAGEAYLRAWTRTRLPSASARRIPLASTAACQAT